MDSKLAQSWNPLTAVQCFLMVVLMLGVAFRFVNLDQKVYWGDEAYSSSRIAGYTAEEVVQALYTGQELSVEEVLKYQNANSERHVGDTLRVIATEAPHHPPLYYIMARVWEEWFGTSVGVKRCLPALISLFIFPGLYWICWELWGSSLTGWIAIALVAVSPIHLLYAQEVREYSLWTVSVLLATASLLYAARVKTKWSWSVYALSIAIALYSHLFSGMVVLGHGIYVFSLDNWRWSKRLKNYLVSATVGLALFIPWILIFIKQEHRVSKGWAWVVQDISQLNFYQRWLTNLVRGFFDVQVENHDPFDLPFSYDEPTTYIIIPVVVLVTYSIYFLLKKAPRSVWLLILILMASTTLPLVLPDLISGGRRSTIARYQLPSYIGIQLAVAYLLSTKLSTISAQWQQTWRFITVVLISCGVASCAFIAQSDTWWTKYTDYHNAQVAQTINQSSAPLVWSDSAPNRILALSHLLDPKVRLQLVELPSDVTEIPQEKLPKILGNSKDIFLLETIPPNALLRLEMEKYKGYKFELVYEEEISFKDRKTLLWKLKA